MLTVHLVVISHSNNIRPKSNISRSGGENMVFAFPVATRIQGISTFEPFNDVLWRNKSFLRDAVLRVDFLAHWLLGLWTKLLSLTSA